MSRTIETTVYQFAELSDTAKERARDWFRGCITADELTDYNDWTTIATILGIEFKQNPVKLRNGNTLYDPAIWWSGFSSQGDGASFEGTYSYSKGAVKAIKAYAGQDMELHRIAEELTAIQKRYFYKIRATMKVSGHYCHSGCMTVDVSNDQTDYWNSSSKAFGEASEQIIRLMRDFADWIYQQLSNQNDYLNSDEAIDEAMELNEYEFSKNGKRV